MKNKGFTLIEMLIVVVIIGILSSIVLVGVSGFRERARDTKRVADLRQVQNALEVYYAKNTVYPNQPADWAGLATSLAGLISSLPSNPKGSDYTYVVSENKQHYVLGATLEVAGHSAFDDDIDNSSLPDGIAAECGGGTSESDDLIYCVGM